MAGALVSIIDRAYYNFVFLPNYHGSYGDSAKKLVDLEGFFAYVKTVPGGVLFGLTMFLFLSAAVCLLFPRVSGTKRANHTIKADEK